MEKFFWADQIADRIIKEKGDKKQYICASGVTPSGIAHMGHLREVIITELVVRALKDKGKKVKFIYSWDDYDRFRKIPKNIPKSYEKYLGMPVSEFPSPFNKKLDYARYFEKPFEDDLKPLGIQPEFIRQNEMNKKCKYAELIKIAIEKKEIIKDILNKYRKEPLKENWYPLSVYCEKCKKDFTKILSINDYIIEYKCKCGFKNKIDFRKKGIIKAVWRVDWPMRWKYEKVDFEPGGIDHSVIGGSYTTSKEIIKKVFDYNAPIYQIYEWVRPKGGIEFSSSSGNAIPLSESLKIYEPEVLRYLFVRTKPKTGFQISFDNDVIKIYEDYDTLEKKYYENKINPKEKRIYELSQVNKVKKKRIKKTSFRHLITFIQTSKGISPSDKVRAEKVKNWLEKYAGEDMKFKVQNKLKVKFSGKDKEALLELKKTLQKKDFTEKELFNEFYKICEKVKIKNTEFFDIAYKAIINKKKGPRLANLILIAGKENIIKLLGQIK